MDKIYNLSNRAKALVASIISAWIVVFTAAIYWELFNNHVEYTTPTAAVFATSLPLIAALSVLSFVEKKENVSFIEYSVDTFIDIIIRDMINNRFFGEPFDSKRDDPNFSLKCAVYHKKREPHAGYKITYKDISFEFTLLLTVYKLTLFIFVPLIDQTNSHRAQAIETVCGGLKNIGFKIAFEPPISVDKSPPNYEPTQSEWTTVYIECILADHFADLATSPRQQYMLAREITEWCRTIMRKICYDGKVFSAISTPVPNL